MFPITGKVKTFFFFIRRFFELTQEVYFYKTCKDVWDKLDGRKYLVLNLFKTSPLFLLYIKKGFH